MIQKKSLIKNLETVKKANIAAGPTTNESVSTRKTTRKTTTNKAIRLTNCKM